ncbi:MAG: LysR family transcriptional regulator [Oscillospiraceae bacterium]|nr:LysR family transcriptional regulator [Oscillospiraceae bacterium]
MSIRKYQAFLKVVELGSISRAAELLGYTQSAVSRMVADIEDEWGLSLLKRGRSGLSLSSDGIAMLPYIKELCGSYRSMQEHASALRGVDTGFIRIGSCASVSTQLLPGVLKEFTTRYPGIDFQLRNMEYDDIEDAIREGEVDCGFIFAPYGDEIDFIHLYSDRILAVLPPKHPMADSPCYPIDNLSREPMIKLTEEGSREVSKLYSKLHARLREPMDIFCEVNDDYSAMAMVESGLGVSVLSELVTLRMPFNIVLKEFDDPISRDIGIAVRKGAPPSPATVKFLEVVKLLFGGK